MFALTIAAMFSGLNHEVGPANVQLSDLLAAATIFLVALRDFSAPRVSPPLAMLLAAYLLVFCLSALSVGLANGIKEMVQIALLLTFLFVAFGYYRTRSTDRLLIIASVLIVMILLYNIGWHLLQQRYVGWKGLNEPKTLFTLLPLLLLLLHHRFGHSWSRPMLVLIVPIIALIILLSGERKAYLAATTALLVWLGPANWRLALLVLVMVPALYFAPSLDRTGYLERQLSSVVARVATDADQTTLSDTQRAASNRFGLEKWRRAPIVGIGTNGYAMEVMSQPSIPEHLRGNVHGEFYRALFENGILGLGLYVAVWAGALTRAALGWASLRATDPRWGKIVFLYVSTSLIYCAFEAGKGLTLASLCALPFVAALPGSRSRPATSARALSPPASKPGERARITDWSSA